MDLSTQMLKRFHDNNEAANLALVGAGGVGSGADAYAQIRAGACANANRPRSRINHASGPLARSLLYCLFQ